MQAGDQSQLLWQRSLEGKLGTPFAAFAVTEDTLVLGVEQGERYGIQNGMILALDKAQGEEKWRFELAPGRVARSLQCAQGRILVGSQDSQPLAKADNRFLALDAASGEIAWSYSVPAHSLSAPAMLGDILFFTTNNNQGYGLNLEDGRLCWRVDHLPSWNAMAPAAGETYFYVGARAPLLTAIRAKDGSVETLYEGAGDFLSAPVYHRGLLYAEGGDRQLVAIDVASRKLRWQAPLGRGASSPPVVGVHLYIGVKDTVAGKPAYGLSAIDLESGQLLWNFRTEKHVLAPPAVEGERILVGSRDGRLHNLDASTGRLKWSFEAGDGIVSRPATIGDRIYFGTRRGELYAITPPPVTAEPQSAAAYREQQQWEMAGLTAALAGDFAAAAADFEHLEQPYRLAQLYERAEMWAMAASTYIAAGLNEKAALNFQRAGDPHGAVDAMVAADQFEEAAHMYQQLGLMADAALSFEKAGRKNQAAAAYAQAGERQRAADLYLALNNVDAAAQVYLDAGELAAAATIFERAEKWGRAAELWLENKQLHQAAEMYRQAGQIQQAAQLFEQADETQTAITLYRRMEDATALGRLGHWQAAAETYLKMNPPLHFEAAGCYERAQQWGLAAAIYLEQACPERAAACWIEAGRRDQALEILSQVAAGPVKAELLERVAAFSEAATIWAELGEVSEAVRLYRLADQNQEALDLLAQQGAWRRLRSLAQELNEPEQEAAAALQLAGGESWEQQLKLYREAAEALVKAAQRYTGDGSKSDEVIATLWEEAADLYEKALEPEEAAKCLQLTRQLRRLPEVAVSITTASALVAEEWQTLAVNITNVGFGAARLITIRMASDLFEGDDLHTQQFMGLHPQRTQSLEYRVRPKETAVGDSVPMDFEIGYLLPNGEQFRRRIRGEVPVKRTRSQRLSTADLSAGTHSLDGSLLINIYRDGAHFIDPTAVQPETIASATSPELSGLRFLRDQIKDHFDESELRDLGFDLGIPYDHLAGDTVPAKARSLVERCLRENRLEELRDQCRELRPLIQWDETA